MNAKLSTQGGARMKLRDAIRKILKSEIYQYDGRQTRVVDEIMQAFSETLDKLTIHTSEDGKPCYLLEDIEKFKGEL
jgi:hypothetical protein